VSGRVLGERNQVARHVQHTVDQLFLATPLIDVTRQPNVQPPARPLVVEHNRRDVHPDPVSGARTYFQIEICKAASRSFPVTGRRFLPARQRRGTDRVAGVQHLVDVAAQDLIRRKAEQPFGCLVPGADLAGRSDRIRRIRRPFE
jgi:hypothetical protein